MIELEENQKILSNLRDKLKLIEESLKITDLKSELEELNKLTQSANFWNNSQESSTILGKIKGIEHKVNLYDNLRLELENLIEMNSLLILENDDDLGNEVLENTSKLVSNIEKLEIQTLFSGKYDNNNAIITLHPGARRNRITRLGRNAI